jgi:SAM-dependent methyltransferase
MKLNLGCGHARMDGYTNVDVAPHEAVDVVCDLREPWPWEDGSAEAALAHHFVEHLDGMERVHFWNELYRVLAPGGQATIVVPHWSSGRAYGDPTHKWPPFSEFAFFYLNKDWRSKEAPQLESMYRCDFEATWGYGLNPAITTRNTEFQEFAVGFYREAAYDLHVTLTKK